MSAFATEPAEARADFIYQFATESKIPAYIVEKDFWVCWLLGRVFATPDLGADCVFKGATSLSKVFGVIDRFSEDIDLGISPVSLGWKEIDLDEAPSNTARQKRMKQLEADCANAVQSRFMPELESVVRAILGARQPRGVVGRKPARTGRRGTCLPSRSSRPRPPPCNPGAEQLGRLPICARILRAIIILVRGYRCSISYRLPGLENLSRDARFSCSNCWSQLLGRRSEASATADVWRWRADNQTEQFADCGVSHSNTRPKRSDPAPRSIVIF